MSSLPSAGSKPGGARNLKKGYELDQKRRVKDAIERQKAARKERIDLARRLEDAGDGNQSYEGGADACNDVSVTIVHSAGVA